MLLRTLILIVLFTVSCSSVPRAQTISLYFPDRAGQEYALHLYQGQNMNLVADGKIDESGKAQIVIPDTHAGFSGVGLLSINDGEMRIQLIVNNESFSIAVNSETGIIFENSPENNFMVDFFSNRNPRQVAINMYAPRYIELLKFQNDLAQSQDNLFLRNHLRRRLDMEALYTSGLWNDIISATFNLHRNRRDFGVDMVEALRRINDQTVFEALAEDLITICTQFGWETAQDEIVEFLINSQRIQHPSGRLFFAFRQHKVRPGIKAPALIDNEKEIELRNVLLLFHESGCPNCELQMQEVVRHYASIRAKGYEVVSVSADLEEETFKRSIANFPWKIKLVDFQNFEGVNFVNYGIIGTPSMYLINADGIVIGRQARLQDFSEFSDLYR